MDSLVELIRTKYRLDALAPNSMFLFCGRKSDRIKVLHYDKVGLLLMSYRLSDGRFVWPRSSEEAKLITRREYRWLLDGLSINQPNAIQQCTGKKDF